MHHQNLYLFCQNQSLSNLITQLDQKLWSLGEEGRLPGQRGSYTWKLAVEKWEAKLRA